MTATRPMLHSSPEIDGLETNIPTVIHTVAELALENITTPCLAGFSRLEKLHSAIAATKMVSLQIVLATLSRERGFSQYELGILMDGCSEIIVSRLPTSSLLTSDRAILCRHVLHNISMAARLNRDILLHPDKPDYPETKK